MCWTALNGNASPLIAARLAQLPMPQKPEAQGHLKDGGQPLEPGGKMVHGKNNAITDGPYAPSKDLTGGSSIISATNAAQSAELAKGGPIFDVDGSVEVRPVRSMAL